jgi:hypothetical protein
VKLIVAFCVVTKKKKVCYKESKTKDDDNFPRYNKKKRKEGLFQQNQKAMTVLLSSPSTLQQKKGLL